VFAVNCHIAFIKCRNNNLVLSCRIHFLLKIFCLRNTSVGHLNDYCSHFIDWKGYAQASLSLHRPLIRELLPSSTWRPFMLEPLCLSSVSLHFFFFLVGNVCCFFFFLPVLQFLMAPTKLPVSAFDVVVDKVMLLNYYVQ
jgi:hypothetical protein